MAAAPWYPGTWDTAAVAFHESFWVATSAVAPVIALAAVVALPDASTMVDVTARSRRTIHPVDRVPFRFVFATRRTVVRLARWWSLLIWGTTIFNLIAQAGLLAVSLWALAYNQDVMPPLAGIALAAGGILLLALTATVASNFDRWAETPGTVGGPPVGTREDDI